MCVHGSVSFVPDMHSVSGVMHIYLLVGQRCPAGIRANKEPPYAGDNRGVMGFVIFICPTHHAQQLSDHQDLETLHRLS
jgi:hypothetical protein